MLISASDSGQATDMQRPSWNTPWWQWSLYSGVAFGVLQVLFHLGSDRLVPAIIGGVAGGAVFGALMGPYTARQCRRARHVVGGDLSAADQRTVSKAASRGPVPTDPRLRQAAQLLATYLAERNRKLLWFNTGTFIAFAALSVFLVLSDGPIWLLATFLFLALAVWAGLMPGHYERRARVLRDSPVPT